MTFASQCTLTQHNLRASATAWAVTPPPDLSYCRYVHDACWSNIHQSLGSDHYNLTMQAHMSPCKPRPHALRYTDWDAFRARRQHSAIPEIEDFSQWTDQLRADLDGVTEQLTTALITCRPLIQASPTGGTSNDITVVFAA
ncbi:hypothetical protein MTO96_040721 [Rhipicephalus appendiculatus]